MRSGIDGPHGPRPSNVVAPDPFGLAPASAEATAGDPVRASIAPRGLGDLRAWLAGCKAQWLRSSRWAPTAATASCIPFGGRAARLRIFSLGRRSGTRLLGVTPSHRSRRRPGCVGRSHRVREQGDRSRRRAANCGEVQIEAPTCWPSGSGRSVRGAPRVEPGRFEPISSPPLLVVRAPPRVVCDRATSTGSPGEHRSRHVGNGVNGPRTLARPGLEVARFANHERRGGCRTR